MTAQPPLIPREPRTMRQPKKELLRQAVIELTNENIRLRHPWWKRLLRKSA